MGQATQQSSVAMEKQPQEACLFCELVHHRNREILAENRSFVAVFDNFPVNEGHTLLISKRHIATVFDMFNHEGTDLLELLRDAKALLHKRFHADAYNVGINCGEAAGQTVPHLHIHLIPRYWGDVDNPRGGIRNFKKALVSY